MKISFKYINIKNWITRSSTLLMTRIFNVSDDLFILTHQSDHFSRNLQIFRLSNYINFLIDYILFRFQSYVYHDFLKKLDIMIFIDDRTVNWLGKFHSMNHSSLLGYIQIEVDNWGRQLQQLDTLYNCVLRKHQKSCVPMDNEQPGKWSPEAKTFNCSLGLDQHLVRVWDTVQLEFRKGFAGVRKASVRAKWGPHMV